MSRGTRNVIEQLFKYDLPIESLVSDQIVPCTKCCNNHHGFYLSLSVLTQLSAFAPRKCNDLA